MLLYVCIVEKQGHQGLEKKQMSIKDAFPIPFIGPMEYYWINVNIDFDWSSFIEFSYQAGK